MARPESTLPQMPDYSFKAPEVSTGPAQLALARQAQEQKQNQQSLDNILQTTKMASELAQTFVEMSKQRQQKDAIKAYFAMKDPTSPIQNIALANPQQASQDIMSAAYPKINSLSALATQGILTGNQGQVDQATKAEQQMKQPQVGKIYQKQLPDGPHNMRLEADGTESDLGSAVAKAGGGSMGGKTINRLMPDGKTHIIQVHPDQTETDLGLAGSSSSNVPTAQARSTSEFATTLLPHISEMRQLVEKADSKGLIGPTAGRVYGQFLAGKVGTTGNAEADQILGQLRATDSLMKTGAMKVHFGSRGGQQMYEHFSDLLNSGKQSKATLNGALDGIQSFMEGYANAGKPGTSTHSGITIDHNALDAELSKRGLQ